MGDPEKIVESVSQEQLEKAFKEALRSYVDDMIKQFGWWSLKGIASIIAAALLWLAFYYYTHK